MVVGLNGVGKIAWGLKILSDKDGGGLVCNETGGGLGMYIGCGWLRCL